MIHKITEDQLDIEVKQTITAHYDKNTCKRLDMIVNPVKMRVRFDVYRLESMDDKPVYSGQSLKQAMKIYNEVGQ